MLAARPQRVQFAGTRAGFFGMKLSNQVAIVTGAGRNIGESIATMLASEGAKVAVVDMDRERGDKVAAAIGKAGGEAARVRRRCLRPKPISPRWSRPVVGALGPHRHPGQQCRDLRQQDHPRHHQGAMGRGDRGDADRPVPGEPHVARQMVAQGTGGKIVNVGSTSGFFGRSRAIAYTAAKGGVVNLTRAMAVQLAPLSDPRQRRGAEQDRLAGRQGRVRPDAGRSSTCAAGPACRSTWRAPCCSWFPRIPTSSPGPCCSSMAASAP